MKTTNVPIRQVGVIRENQLFSNYRKTIFNIWFDGEQVIDTMSHDELVALRDIINDAINEYVDNIVAAKQEGSQK